MNIQFSRALWKLMAGRVKRHAAAALLPLAGLIALMLQRAPSSPAWIVATALCAALMLYGACVAAGLWTAVLGLPRELRRKGLQTLVGALVVSLAGLTRSPAAVALLCGLVATASLLGERLESLALLRKLVLDRPAGPASHGELLFPLGLAAALVVTRGITSQWLAAALILIVADAVAALVGSAFGRHRFVVLAGLGTKSLEGSAAFFVCTGMIVLLAWGGDAPWREAVLYGVLVAAALTALEALSVRGTDNLLLPIAAAAFGQCSARPAFGLGAAVCGALGMLLLTTARAPLPQRRAL